MAELVTHQINNEMTKSDAINIPDKIISDDKNIPSQTEKEIQDKKHDDIKVNNNISQDNNIPSVEPKKRKKQMVTIIFYASLGICYLAHSLHFILSDYVSYLFLIFIN